MTKRIGIIGFDGVSILDVAAPIETFAAANALGGTRAYALTLVSATGRAFRNESGFALTPSAGFRDAPAFDTLIVPGGAGLRDRAVSQPVVAFLKARAHSTRRIVSICTGLEALAQTGLMKGRRATTHWRFAAAMAGRYPDVRLDADAIYLRDGHCYTSGGLTSGIDLCLALIADDLGEKTALRVARELVVPFKRAGGQAQYSEPLEFQTRAADGFADLAGWILAHLKKDLSVTALAAKANLSTRQFTRRFTAAFGQSPASYVERLCLDEARRRLGLRRETVERIALSVGYASADAFTRAFERRFGITPSAYRKTLS